MVQSSSPPDNDIPDGSTNPSSSAVVSNNGEGVLAKTYTNFNNITTIATTYIMQHFSLYYKAKAFIYNSIILKMTEKWYRTVLEQLHDGSIILDVGIGTGGALLRCIDLIESKDLKIIGI